MRFDDIYFYLIVFICCSFSDGDRDSMYKESVIQNITYKY